MNKEASFLYLKSLQIEEYKEFETQQYMTIPIFTNTEVNLIPWGLVPQTANSTSETGKEKKWPAYCVK